MKLLEKFESIQIKITWTAIKIGLDGINNFPPCLNPKEVVDYATQKVLLNENEQYEVILLAGESCEKIKEIKQLVDELSRRENKDIMEEFRKWRLIYIVDTINNLSFDPVKNLLDIGDAWVMFEFPSDSPHIFQGVGNNILPQYYYTQQMFDEIKIRHKKWIEEELLYLKRNE